jgi:prolyl oligopeptidase
MKKLGLKPFMIATGMLGVLNPLLAQSQVVKYPATRVDDHKDLYHGIEVSDPYRWLEDDRSEETKAWVEEQNKVTFDYLGKIPFRAKVLSDMEKYYNYPKYSEPAKKGDYYYYLKNDGLQNQSVLYRQKGNSGVPEIVFDPNTLSAGGTVKLAALAPSKDGSKMVIGTSKGGSDWILLEIMDLKTLKMLPDKIEWVKVSGVAWQGDGFYYSRYPKPEGSALADKNENHQVYYHRVGELQEKDELIFEDKKNPQRFHLASTTEDEQYVVLSVSDRGLGKDGNALFYRKRGEAEFKPIVSEISDFSYDVIDNEGDNFLVKTNSDAPNWRVDLFSTPQRTWKVLIPEKPEPLREVAAGGGKLFAIYKKDVTSRVHVYHRDGKFEREVGLPGLGTVSGFYGEKGNDSLFYVFTSFLYPPTIFSYEVAGGKSEVFRSPEMAFNPTDYETKQVFYPSKDGTKIPMFVTYKKGLSLDGTNPTLLYGYGGFNISLEPSFSATRIGFLDQGGVYAQANLRGGSEYGEIWHEQGMRAKKQNVFDDFIAAAEYLIREKYTSPSKLALQGGSNGGLLVGAVANQRPDLFQVALPAVGVMDMLRYQKFTIGWNWIAEFGSSDKEDEFNVLYAYSPLHNIQKGVGYPATLITTADHDDRVVPAHSFKYAAALQATAGASSSNPLLIRIDTNSGHGASNTKKALETQADIYSFMFANFGLLWK